MREGKGGILRDEFDSPITFSCLGHLFVRNRHPSRSGMRADTEAMLQSNIVPVLVCAKDDRKMCACSTKCSISPYTHNLEKGRSPAPFYPSGGALSPDVELRNHLQAKSFIWHSTGIEPDAAPTNVWPFDHHLREPPSYPQDPHGHVMETNPSRIGCAPTSSRLDGDQGVCRPWTLHRGDFALPWTPSSQGPSSPWQP